jgi:hypothetical protein
MGTLDAWLPLPMARACWTALSAHADACRVPGDLRGKEERMADLLLRPGAADRPPVQVSLTVVAPAAVLLGGDEPGEVDGGRPRGGGARAGLHARPAVAAAAAPDGEGACSPGG